jgi:hypothetical protein
MRCTGGGWRPKRGKLRKDGTDQLTINTSYVAEWKGGGRQDLLRRFDSFRNCERMAIGGSPAGGSPRGRFDTVGGTHSIDRVGVAAAVDGHRLDEGRVGGQAGHIIRGKAAYLPGPGQRKQFTLRGITGQTCRGRRYLEPAVFVPLEVVVVKRRQFGGKILL